MSKSPIIYISHEDYEWLLEFGGFRILYWERLIIIPINAFWAHLVTR